MQSRADCPQCNHSTCHVYFRHQGVEILVARYTLVTDRGVKIGLVKVLVLHDKCQVNNIGNCQSKYQGTNKGGET